jgi:glycerol-3-phosphate dehydrogenase
MLRTSGLDTRQRALAKRLIAFRQKLLDDVNNKKSNRQMVQSMKSMDNALRILRDAANQLRRYDAVTFAQVVDVIKSLQGDLTNKR